MELVIEGVRVSPAMVAHMIRTVRAPHSPMPRRLVIKAGSWPFTGTAWPHLSRIVLEIGSCAWYPYTRPAMAGGYLSVALRSPREALVYLLAHELRHLWQRKYRRPRLGGGRIGCLSELDADTWALQRLQAWRKQSNSRRSTQ